MEKGIQVPSAWELIKTDIPLQSSKHRLRSEPEVDSPGPNLTIKAKKSTRPPRQRIFAHILPHQSPETKVISLKPHSATTKSPTHLTTPSPRHKGNFSKASLRPPNQRSPDFQRAIQTHRQPRIYRIEWASKWNIFLLVAALSVIGVILFVNLGSFHK